MRILLTSSRAPVTLELVRALARAGHTVFATDTFAPTIASHSRCLTGHRLTPPPRQQPTAFAAALEDILHRERIDLLVPTCEEVFYVGMFHDRLSQVCRVLCDPLDQLDAWHNKFTFQRRAAALGLATPATALANDGSELREAVAQTPRFVLKPAYSRFGSRVLIHRGEGDAPLGRCRPTPQQPWLVQEFIAGPSLCSYSVVHAGHVTAHVAYATPHRVGHGAGVSFRAVDGSESLTIVQRLLSESCPTGQLSFDYVRGGDGRLYLLECNPRATSGVHVHCPSRLAGALTDPAAPTWVEPAGRYQQLLPVVLAANPLVRQAAPPAWCDVVLNRHDPLPALMQLAQLWHLFRVSRRRGVSLIEATTDDIEWNGPDLSAAPR